MVIPGVRSAVPVHPGRRQAPLNDVLSDVIRSTWYWRQACLDAIPRIAEGTFMRTRQCNLIEAGLIAVLIAFLGIGAAETTDAFSPGKSGSVTQAGKSSTHHCGDSYGADDLRVTGMSCSLGRAAAKRVFKFHLQPAEGIRLMVRKTVFFFRGGNRARISFRDESRRGVHGHFVTPQT